MEQSPALIDVFARSLLTSDISIQSRTVIGLDPTAELNGSEVQCLIKPQREPDSSNHQVKAAGDSPTCCRGTPPVEVCRLPRYKQPCAIAKCCCLTRECAEKQADRLNGCLKESNPNQTRKISSVGRKPLDPVC